MIDFPEKSDFSNNYSEYFSKATFDIAIGSVFFRFWAPNSDRFFGLIQANFEANSADFTHLPILDQNQAKTLQILP